MNPLRLKPNHKALRAFFQELATLQQAHAGHEGAVAPAFAALLRVCASQLPGWKLVEQYAIPRDGRRPIRVDGTILDCVHATATGGFYGAFSGGAAPAGIWPFTDWANNPGQFRDYQDC